MIKEFGRRNSLTDKKNTNNGTKKTLTNLSEEDNESVQSK